jgi:hypothetical protein
VQEDAAAMRVDMPAMIIKPDFARTESAEVLVRRILLCNGRRHRATEAEAGAEDGRSQSNDFTNGVHGRNGNTGPFPLSFTCLGNAIAGGTPT